MDIIDKALQEHCGDLCGVLNESTLRRLKFSIMSIVSQYKVFNDKQHNENNTLIDDKIIFPVKNLETVEQNKINKEFADMKQVELTKERADVVAFAEELMIQHKIKIDDLFDALVKKQDEESRRLQDLN